LDVNVSGHQSREFDAVGVVNDAVDDGISERGNANQVVPAVDWNMTGLMDALLP
jgi:hypothetical protein